MTFSEICCTVAVGDAAKNHSNSARNVCRKKAAQISQLEDILWGMECIGLATKKVRGFEATFQFCQNDTFEPVHEIQKFSWPKEFF